MVIGEYHPDEHRTRLDAQITSSHRVVADSEFGQGTRTVRASGLIRSPSPLVMAATVATPGVVLVPRAVGDCVHASPPPWARVAAQSAPNRRTSTESWCIVP